MIEPAGKIGRAAVVGVMSLAFVFAGAAYAGKPAHKKEKQDPVVKTAVPASWTCSLCPYKYGWSGRARLGLMKVSQSSYKYGEYTGLTRSGGYFDAGFKVRYRDKQGHYLYARGSRLGLASRKVEIQGGKQGAYELSALYEGIPHYLYQSAQTPFRSAGSSNLTLPSSWVTGGSTAQMPQLNASLRPVDIQRTRRVERVDARIPRPKSHWTYDVGYQHETQKGVQIVGGSFLTTSSLLPESIDYATDQVNASANYAVKLWQLKLAYYGSFFHDSNTALRWQNPFTPFIPGADIGQLGQAPSNNFNQLSLAGAWLLPWNTRIMAMLAYGRGKQDAQFLPVTVNPNLQTGALPRSSLDGEVITRNYVLRINANPSTALSLNADYTFDRHQDLTAPALFPQVLTDAYVASPLINNPYSFENRDTQLGAEYHVDRTVRIGLGAEHKDARQTFENVTTTKTNSVWVSSHIRPARQVTVYLKVLGSNRFAPDYVPLAELLLPENPLLRQYNVGKRIRKQGQARLSYSPIESVSLSFQWQQNIDQYKNTQIGLTDSRDTNYTFNLSMQPSRHVSLSGYYTEERILNNQAGSQTLSTADWYGDRKDIVRTAGIDAQWSGIVPRWDLGMSLLYQLARGQLAVVQPATPGEFPDIVERMQGVQLYAKGQLSERFALQLGYALQRYRSNDWVLDNITPSTIPNVLTMGLQSPNYTVNVVAISVEYTF